MDDEPVAVPIEGVFDLHPFQPQEIRDVAREYLMEARARGYREVRLIHGRGKGVQRASIRRLLATLDFVASFRDDEFLGATVVVLRA